jgi:hypothetical protein
MRRVFPTTSTVLVVSSVVLAAAQPVAAQVPQGSPYIFTLEPYGYLHWAHVDTSIRGFDSTTVLGPGQ